MDKTERTKPHVGATVHFRESGGCEAAIVTNVPKPDTINSPDGIWLAVLRAWSGEYHHEQAITRVFAVPSDWHYIEDCTFDS